MLVMTLKQSKLRLNKYKNIFDRKGAFAPFFIVVCLLISTFSQAQQSSKLFHAEIYMGGLLSQVAGDGFSGYRKLGWNAELGVSVDGKQDSTSIYFGIGIRRMGAFQPINLETQQLNKFNYTLDYITLPVRYQTWRWGMHFQLGASILRLFSAKKEFNEIASNSDLYRNWQLSGDIFVGFEVNKNLKWNLFAHQSLIPIENISSNNGFYWERGGLAMTIGTGFSYQL